MGECFTMGGAIIVTILLAVLAGIFLIILWILGTYERGYREGQKDLARELKGIIKDMEDTLNAMKGGQSGL